MVRPCIRSCAPLLQASPYCWFETQSACRLLSFLVVALSPQLFNNLGTRFAEPPFCLKWVALWRPAVCVVTNLLPLAARRTPPLLLQAQERAKNVAVNPTVPLGQACWISAWLLLLRYPWSIETWLFTSGKATKQRT